MYQSIPQDVQENKQVAASIKRFFTRFHVNSALKSANAYKRKGVAVAEIFQYLFVLIFSNRSMYMDLLVGKNPTSFAKDTVYRFLKMSHIHWIRFTSLLSARIIEEAVAPLTQADRVNVLIVDDSIYERNRSKKVELLSKVYDHAKHVYRLGFRLLTLGWSDGNSFFPVNSILLSSEKQKNRIHEAANFDKRSLGHKRRVLSVTKATESMLELLKAAKQAMIPATYVLFDSWFSSPKSLHAVKEIGYDVIAMVKKTSKMFFTYQGKKLSLPDIYRQNQKRRGRSRYLLSVCVDVEKQGERIPAKVVFVRNRNKRKEYLCLICTNPDLCEEEIIRIYGKRWDIEVFFKVCKSYLHLTKECQSLCFDAMTAHVAVVFTRYMMLSLENRETNDERSWGELFLRLSDEQADITWMEAFHTLLTLLRQWVCEHIQMEEAKLLALMDLFIQAIPPLLQNLLLPAG